MRPTLYIAGDVHLDGSPNAFIAWLDSLATLPPARLIILGDLFDYWLDTDASAERGRYCTDRLQRLADAGWRLDLIVGNREMAAGRRLAAATRCRLAWPGIRLRLGSASVHVVHGDRLCRDPGQRLLHAHMRAFWLTVCRLAVPEYLQEWVAGRLRRLSRRGHVRRHRERPGNQSSVPLDPVRIRRSARGADHLVAGHIHQCWRRPVAGIDMMLVGDWGPQRGSWVVGYGDGRLIQVRHRFRSDEPIPVGARSPAA